MASITSSKPLTLCSLPDDTFPIILNYLLFNDLNSVRHTNSFLRKRVHENFNQKWLLPRAIENHLVSSFFNPSAFIIPENICLRATHFSFAGGNIPSQCIIKHFPNLEFFYSNESLVNNRDVELFVQKLPRLTSLHVSKGLLSNECFDCFHYKTAATITSLSLRGTRGISDRGIATLVENVPSLTELSLFPIVESRITDAAVTAITTHAHQLRFLSLTHSAITDVALTELGKKTHQIKELWLDGCQFISDEGIEALMRHCSSIIRLNLSYTKITEKALEAIQKYRASSLQYLNISDCEQLTTTHFYFWQVFSPKAKKYLSKCTALSELHMNGLKLEDADVDAITKKMQKLTLFSATFNPVTQKATDLLKTNCPSLSSVFL